MSHVPSFEVELVGSRVVSPAVKELAFARADGAPVTFEAGQWVNLRLPLAAGEARRAYSIASEPRNDARFELAITKVDGGEGSTLLHALPVGAKLVAEGPQGFFTRAATAPDPALFVATGTGLTPLRSMLRHALAAGATSPMVLLLGVRTAVDRLYAEELEALAARHPNLTFETTLSRADDGWTGRRGYVQEHVRELFEGLAAHGTPHAYICGLERMTSAVRDVLRKQMGVARQQVHSERYD